MDVMSSKVEHSTEDRWTISSERGNKGGGFKPFTFVEFYSFCSRLLGMQLPVSSNHKDSTSIGQMSAPLYSQSRGLGRAGRRRVNVPSWSNIDRNVPLAQATFLGTTKVYPSSDSINTKSASDMIVVDGDAATQCRAGGLGAG